MPADTVKDNEASLKRYLNLLNEAGVKQEHFFACFGEAYAAQYAFVESEVKLSALLKSLWLNRAAEIKVSAALTLADLEKTQDHQRKSGK